MHRVPQDIFVSDWGRFHQVYIPLRREPIEVDISAEKKGQRIVWRLHLSRHRRES